MRMGFALQKFLPCFKIVCDFLISLPRVSFGFGGKAGEIGYLRSKGAVCFDMLNEREILLGRKLIIIIAKGGRDMNDAGAVFLINEICSINSKSVVAVREPLSSRFRIGVIIKKRLIGLPEKVFAFNASPRGKSDFISIPHESADMGGRVEF